MQLALLKALAACRPNSCSRSESIAWGHRLSHLFLFLSVSPCFVLSSIIRCLFIVLLSCTASSSLFFSFLLFSFAQDIPSLLHTLTLPKRSIVLSLALSWPLFRTSAPLSTPAPLPLLVVSTSSSHVNRICTNLLLLHCIRLCFTFFGFLDTESESFGLHPYMKQTGTA